MCSSRHNTPAVSSLQLSVLTRYSLRYFLWWNQVDSAFLRTISFFLPCDLLNCFNVHVLLYVISLTSWFQHILETGKSPSICQNFCQVLYYPLTGLSLALENSLKFLVREQFCNCQTGKEHWKLCETLGTFKRGHGKLSLLTCDSILYFSKTAVTWWTSILICQARQNDMHYTGNFAIYNCYLYVSSKMQ